MYLFCGLLLLLALGNNFLLTLLKPDKTINPVILKGAAFAQCP